MTNRLALHAATTVLFLALGLPLTAQAAPNGKGDFDELVTEVLAQLDIQLHDREALIARVEELYDKLTEASREGFERDQDIRRRAEILSDSFLLTDVLIRNPEDGVVLPLKEYLERTINRDQAHFENYQDQYDKIRFGIERQLATLKGEQTLLKNIRRDLETVRKYPDNKDRALFFVNSVKAVLDSFDSGDE